MAYFSGGGGITDFLRCARYTSLPLDVRVGSTIGFRKERAVVVAQWVCARTRGSELSTYPVRGGPASFGGIKVGNELVRDTRNP